MTLAVHAIIGAAAAHRLGLHNPMALFLVGAATHYIADAIPHWDYGFLSFPHGEKAETRRWPFTSAAFRKDLVRIACDGALGAGLILFVAKTLSWASATPLLLASFGGMAPDLLQGIYFTGYAPFLAPLQRFHDFCHTEIKLGPYPAIGIPFQIGIALAAAYFLRF